MKLEGPSIKGREILQHQADELRNLPFDEAKTEALVSNIRGGGAVDAYYNTFQTAASPGSASAAINAPPDNGILIHLRSNQDGPPYLLFSTDAVAMNANVTSTVLNMRFVDENIGSYGSELRTDVQAGYLTHLRTEFYQPVGSSIAFLQTHVEYLRQPVYLGLDQKRVSERLLQQAGGGLDLGLTISRRFQVSAQYRMLTIRWVLKEGADLSDEHFTVDGTLIQAWASQKRFRKKDGSDDGDGTNFHGQKKSNETHQSTTDSEARLYKKSYGEESKLAYLGHALVENRSGFIAAAMATQADGHAERDAALLLLAERQKSGTRRITVGADKAYDAKNFIAGARVLNVTAHVQKNEKGRRSNLDQRTTPPPDMRSALAGAGWWRRLLDG